MANSWLSHVKRNHSGKIKEVLNWQKNIQKTRRLLENQAR